MSIPRRILLQLAGGGLALGPLTAKAAPSEGGAGAPARSPGPEIWTNFFKGQRVWAYVDRHGISPGEPLNVMAASGPGQPSRQVRLEIFRVGAGDPTPVLQTEFVEVHYRGATASAASIGPGWTPSWTLTDTAGWAPGCYYADVVEQTTATRDVRAAFWIVSNPRRSGRVLCRLGTSTYQAYNPWGGHSLYPNGDDEARGLLVSFDRPTPPSFFEYDVYLVKWLEGLAGGLGGVDYASNFDVHHEGAMIDAYPLVVVGSHDEYWTAEEFDAFERRHLQAGTERRLPGRRHCLLSGAVRRSRPAAVGARSRAAAGLLHKTAFDPVATRTTDSSRLVTNNFRTGGRRPETQLLGGAYQNWFEPAGPQRPAFRVARTDLPFFEGTGWKVGDVAAEVVGYEWDNRDPEANGRRLLTAASAPPVIDPNRVQVLFRGDAVAADGSAGVAEATYFTSSAGARVFNAASVRWAWGLGKDGFVDAKFQRFNENLVRALSR